MEEKHAIKNWIFCIDSLPNEDEISYTTMISVDEEPHCSDRVVAIDEIGDIYTGCFTPTMTKHPYKGKCKVNKYTACHSEPGIAGWEFHSHYKTHSDIVAWMPLGEMWV